MSNMSSVSGVYSSSGYNRYISAFTRAYKFLIGFKSGEYGSYIIILILSGTMWIVHSGLAQPVPTTLSIPSFLARRDNRLQRIYPTPNCMQSPPVIPTNIHLP
jgi:hypothetical protein